MMSLEGKLCTINRSGDLWADEDRRIFINSECRIIKKTKAGLIEVELVSDIRRKASFAKYNVDIVGEENE